MTRTRILIAAGALAVVLAAGIVALVIARAGGPDQPPTSTSADQATASATPGDSASPEPKPSYDHPTTVATIAGEELPVFGAPGDAAASSTLGKWSYYGSPLTLLSTEQQERDGTTWLKVLLPVQPNGATGWIRADDVELSLAESAVYVYLDEHELDLVSDGAVVFTAPVAVGAPETPTPLGTYSITDPLDLTSNDTGVYGAYALGLSGFSEVLTEFYGGPPQLAIHGTNTPNLIGESVSNGCIRMHNDDVLRLAGEVGPGTPVIVQQSREA